MQSTIRISQNCRSVVSWQNYFPFFSSTKQGGINMRKSLMIKCKSPWKRRTKPRAKKERLTKESHWINIISIAKSRMAEESHSHRDRHTNTQLLCLMNSEGFERWEWNWEWQMMNVPQTTKHIEFWSRFSNATEFMRDGESIHMDIFAWTMAIYTLTLYLNSQCLL